MSESTMNQATWPILVVAAALLACNGLDSGDKETAGDKESLADGIAADGKSEPTDMIGGDGPSIGGGAKRAGSSRSKVPTSSEWKAVTKEVVVRGSSKLNCDTKMVREWLRVSCRGKNFSGGKPTKVTTLSGGGRGSDFVYSGKGVTSLVVRFVEGVNLKAKFRWSDRSHVLHVYWPRGAPRPVSKGRFIGA
jgi:hypothetical protein